MSKKKSTKVAKKTSKKKAAKKTTDAKTYNVFDKVTFPDVESQSTIDETSEKLKSITTILKSRMGPRELNEATREIRAVLES